MKTARPTSLLALIALAILMPRPALADETADSALWLLKKATLVHQNGMHNVLLRALRQMQDPALQPLFSELVQKRHPVLRIHGILGLGEIDPSKHIKLELVQETTDTGTQAQLVSTALEGKLLSMDQAKQLMAWPALDPGVKVIVAAYLLSEKQPVEPAAVDQALASDNPGIRALAALIKLQMGDAKSMQFLQQLDNSTDVNRDTIRGLVLQTGIRYRFSSIAPWAVKLAGEPNATPSITFLALRAGILFQAPEAAAIWSKRFESSTSPADRIRYSILAVDLADKLSPATFDPMLKDDQEVVRQMAVVGKLIAEKKDPTAEMIKLLGMNNVLTSQWALQQATDGPEAQRKALLIAIIRGAEEAPNDPRFRAQRLESVVIATQHIVENLPDAKVIIPDLFALSPVLTQEAMIMGLIRSTTGKPQEYVAGMTWKSETAEALALLLRAKHDAPLNDEEMKQLQLIVRGGLGLQDPLRVQAAWIYLKRTGQEKFALASLLGK